MCGIPSLILPILQENHSVLDIGMFLHFTCESWPHFHLQHEISYTPSPVPLDLDSQSNKYLLSAYRMPSNELGTGNTGIIKIQQSLTSQAIPESHHCWCPDRAPWQWKSLFCAFFTLGCRVIVNIILTPGLICKLSPHSISQPHPPHSPIWASPLWTSNSRGLERVSTCYFQSSSSSPTYDPHSSTSNIYHKVLYQMPSLGYRGV